MNLGTKIACTLGCLILLFSCAEERNSQINGEEDAVISPLYLQTLSLLKTSEDISIHPSLDVIYQNDELFWIDEQMGITDDGKAALDLLKNAMGYGLNPDSYQTQDLLSASEASLTPETALELEIDLSLAMIDFSNHLSHGIVPNEFKPKITELSLHQDSIHLTSVFVKGEVVARILDLQPDHHQYILLQKALAEFVANNELSNEAVYIPNFKKDSVGAYEKAREVLIKLNYLNPSDSGQKVVDAVKSFQQNNGLTPDGLIGKYTAQILEFTTEKMYYQAAANLEKWRWLEAWGDHYFFANIPEYLIRIYAHDSLVIQNRTVVGTFTNQTPELESQLDYFIVNPEWYVPFSITSKELIPKVQKDPEYLEKNGYMISGGDKSLSDIDWNSVNPNSFKYSIKQKSGGSNALGKVKFIFSNKHSVYFHDTPSKSFFNKDIRSYSHGCVRVQNPFDIAYFVMQSEENPEWPTTLDSLLKYKKTKTFTPQKDYPIHIGYFTSATDSSGQLRTLIDVYQKDTLLSKVFAKYYAGGNDLP